MPEKFIYFPSFSAGSGGNSAKKNFRLKDGTPWRFYSKEYPEFYRHNTFLITAGHNYKKMDYVKDYEFDSDALILGDSGGFQIATGAIKWEDSLVSKIFNWLEANSNIAMNLDIPTRGKFEGKFQEALDISKNNFAYFEKNQTGKTKFLNVLQGYNYDTYSAWYSEVKNYNFSGWGIGGCIGNLPAFLTALVVLLENGEFERKENIYTHFLGMSSIIDFLVLAQVQKSLNEKGSTTQITTDSSTASNAIRFGNYYTGYNLKSMVFEQINIPQRNVINNFNNNHHLPIKNIIDQKIWETYTLGEFLQMEQPHYGWMINHNFSIFKEAIHEINSVIYLDPIIRDQYLSKDMVHALKYIDDVIKDSNPMKVLKRHFNFLQNFSRKSYSETSTSVNEFF